jgi:hypothetical protein
MAELNQKLGANMAQLEELPMSGSWVAMVGSPWQPKISQKISQNISQHWDVMNGWWFGT